MICNKSSNHLSSYKDMTFFKVYIEIELFCNVVLVSTLWKNESYVYIYPLFFGFPCDLGYHRALNRVFCAIQYVLIQFSSVAQSCLPLCDPMDRSLPLVI